MNNIYISKIESTSSFACSKLWGEEGWWGCHQAFNAACQRGEREGAGRRKDLMHPRLANVEDCGSEKPVVSWVWIFWGRNAADLQTTSFWALLALKEHEVYVDDVSELKVLSWFFLGIGWLEVGICFFFEYIRIYIYIYIHVIIM